MWEAAVLAAIVAGALFWVDSLRARERALAAGRSACERYGVQFLDDTVAFARLGLARDAEGRVRLRRGSWSIESHVDRLSAAAPADGGAPARRPIASWSTPEDAAPLEVDLRGMESEEALVALDAGLDRAALVGLSELRIVHGVGRGVLRAAVERHLRGHPQVASQRPGQVGEGGRGVTVAILK